MLESWAHLYDLRKDSGGGVTSTRAAAWHSPKGKITEVICCCSVANLRPHGLQHARLLCPPLSPRDYSNSCPLCLWGYLTISSSAMPFSFCHQSFPESGFFPMNYLFMSGGQSIWAVPYYLCDPGGWGPSPPWASVSLLVKWRWILLP